MQKMCSDCHEIKDIAEFPLTGSGKGRREPQCWDCTFKLYTPKKPAILIEKGRNLKEIETKTCPVCGETKAVHTGFYSVMKGQYFSRACRECCRDEYLTQLQEFTDTLFEEIIAPYLRNHEGFLQIDIQELFPNMTYKKVNSVLRNMVKAGYLNVTKQGRRNYYTFGGCTGPALNPPQVIAEIN